MKVLITGTSNGIGKAIALKFLQNNHTVFGMDIQPSSTGLNNYAVYTHIQLDIRDKESFPDLGDFDIVINNAGVQNSEDDIGVNLVGTINITERYGIHPNIKSILNIGSASAHSGAEFPEYSASKGGVLTYTKNVALRIAEFGATCNSLDLGGVTTDLNKPVMENKEAWKAIMDLTPLKRWATPEEAAEWAYFLTVTNKFCTGQNLLVDGLEYGNAHFIWC